MWKPLKIMTFNNDGLSAKESVLGPAQPTVYEQDYVT